MEIPPQEDHSMRKHGRLNLGNAGYSMPADTSAYQRPPFYYRNTRSITVAFETDLEAALEALPAPLALSEPATAILSFYEYPWTTFGPYNEAIPFAPGRAQGPPDELHHAHRGDDRAADAC